MELATKTQGYSSAKAVMGTDDQSIASKRSVEKLYRSNEPAFLRPFVSKFKRRSPLINRGYWLRMIAIDSSVERFLQQKSETPKVVVNLGCGFDPLPFRMRWKGWLNAAFVDVDYPDLIKRKLEIIQQDSTLRKFLDDELPLLADASSKIIFRSQSYCAVGCDLSNLSSLNKIFLETLEISNSEIMFVAEASITYMSVSAADTLIRWASSFAQGGFANTQVY